VVRSVRHLVATQVDPLGLSSQEFWAIVAIAEHACSSQAELAARMRADEATACRVVRALARAGLVSPLRDIQDRRRIRLELTPQGETLSRRLLPVAQGIRSAIDGALEPSERTATRAALTKILTRLADLLDSGPPAAGVRHLPAGVAKSLPARPALALQRRQRDRRTTASNRGLP